MVRIEESTRQVEDRLTNRSCGACFDPPYGVHSPISPRCVGRISQRLHAPSHVSDSICPEAAIRHRDSPTRKTDILLFRRSPKIKHDTEPPLTLLQHARLQTPVDPRRHLLLHGEPARTKGKRSARPKNRSLPARRRGHCTMAAFPDRSMGGSARTPALHRDAPVRRQ